ncbi:class D sortase [Gorillibacterium massiliense]|uniref:class D sortase n=1 Tax=Gorillibacterium massiliense TaxID=1280390 RepID=UPI0004AC7626|nr:class D sortase [Gorillibacterium massiliense]
MRKFSYILISVGLVLLIYPKADEWYNDYKMKSLLKEIEQSQTVAPSNEQKDQKEQNLQNESDALTTIFRFDSEEPASPSQLNTPPSQPQPSSKNTSAPVNHAIATLIIKKINLKLPVLEGSSLQNMKVAATHMTGTSPIGVVGNTAIAAHRSLTKGRFFNRLNEVAIGDKIIVQTNGQTFTYTVYQTLIVDPKDVSVLNRNEKDRVLTLITCDPVINPTHRLIVHAKI